MMDLNNILEALDNLQAHELEQIRQYIVQKLAETGTEKVGIIAELHGDYDKFHQSTGNF